MHQGNIRPYIKLDSNFFNLSASKTAQDPSVKGPFVMQSETSPMAKTPAVGWIKEHTQRVNKGLQPLSVSPQQIPSGEKVTIPIFWGSTWSHMFLYCSGDKTYQDAGSGAFGGKHGRCYWTINAYYEVICHQQSSKISLPVPLLNGTHRSLN